MPEIVPLEQRLDLARQLGNYRPGFKEILLSALQAGATAGAMPGTGHQATDLMRGIATGLGVGQNNLQQFREQQRARLLGQFQAWNDWEDAQRKSEETQARVGAAKARQTQAEARTLTEKAKLEKVQNEAKEGKKPITYSNEGNVYHWNAETGAYEQKITAPAKPATPTKVDEAKQLMEWFKTPEFTALSDADKQAFQRFFRMEPDTPTPGDARSRVWAEISRFKRGTPEYNDAIARAKDFFSATSTPTPQRVTDAQRRDSRASKVAHTYDQLLGKFGTPAGVVDAINTGKAKLPPDVRRTDVLGLAARDTEYTDKAKGRKSGVDSDALGLVDIILGGLPNPLE